MEEIKMDETALGRGQVATITPEELSEAVKNRDLTLLRQIVETVPDIDIAEALTELPPDLLIRFFRDLKSDEAAPIFDSLDGEAKENLVSSLADRELVELINSQSADDLADTLGEMPANIAVRILSAAKKDMREDLNRLLKFKPGTAGAVMTTEYLEFKEEDSVSRAMNEIRKKGKDAETVYTLFVRDKKRKFVGTVDLDDLIFASPEEKLSDIMNRDAPWVYAGSDQEEMAKAFRRYDLNAMAVLNSDGCLTGIVTIDDAVDVMVEESTEDVEKMAAVSSLDDTYLETHPFKMTRKCAPWIIVLLVLGTFSSMVLSIFQDSLSVVPLLAGFIPIIMGTGGNAGGQTIALMIRGLALGEFTHKDTLRIIGREMLSALLIGLSVAVFSFVWFTLEQYLGIVDSGLNVFTGNCWTLEFLAYTLRISGVVALTLFVAIIVSKLIAVLLPMATTFFKKDPAIVSQPLLTTIVDVTSLLIFFAIAEMFIIPYVV